MVLQKVASILIKAKFMTNYLHFTAFSFDNKDKVRWQVKLAFKCFITIFRVYVALLKIYFSSIVFSSTVKRKKIHCLIHFLAHG